MFGRKRTTFRGGGLKDDSVLSLSAPMRAPSDFAVPAYVDSRPYCLPANDQGNVPACVGFATAALCEITHWKTSHKPQQYDALGIYKKAKEIEGNTEEGTTFTFGVRAAQELGFLDKSLVVRRVTGKLNVQFALHKYGAVLAGFNVTDAWNRANVKNGFIGTPDGATRGGHAVILCWYDDKSVGWQNSWGNWGAHGFGRCTWDQFSRMFIHAAVLEQKESA